MAYRRLSSGRPALLPRRSKSGRRARTGALALLVTSAALVAAPGGPPSHPGARDVPVRVAAAVPFAGSIGPLLDTTLSRGAETFTYGAAAPLGSLSRSIFALADATSNLPDIAPVDAARATPPASSETMQLAQVEPVPALIPLPTPRPAELRASEPRSPRLAAAPMSRRMRVAARAPTVEDNRSFFEKLFGIPASPATPTPALAYAALGNGTLDQGSPGSAPSRRVSPSPFPSAGAGIAIYDISARTVTLPSGERLEAHSGLGDKIDDPRHVHVRMSGATPPGTYNLTEREQLFHGVRAIRLNPVGGSAAIFGRAGLLAHTFMLGPNGDSNGCVSFRDYPKFLQAFLRGEVTRLVVVAGRGGGAWPNFASTGQPAPSDRPARGA